MGCWPVALFDRSALPSPGGVPSPPPTKRLVKLPEKLGHDMESTPILYKGRLLWFHSHRVDRPQPDLGQMHLLIRDPATGEELSRFGRCHSLGSALVDGETVHAFAAEHGRKLNEWFGDIDHFSSTDLKTWRRELAIGRENGEHLLNSSVCRDEQGYLMAYESDQPVKFCFKFARSKDLTHGTRSPEWCLPVRGEPVQRLPGDSLLPPVLLCHLPGRAARGLRGLGAAVGPLHGPRPLAAQPPESRHGTVCGEGINNSDVDLIEFGGRTYVNYFTGNQDDWGDLKWAVYDGPMREFFESYFPPGPQLIEFNAKTK